MMSSVNYMQFNLKIRITSASFVPMKYWADNEQNYITSGTKKHYVMYDFHTASVDKCCLTFIAKRTIKYDTNMVLVHLNILFEYMQSLQ